MALAVPIKRKNWFEMAHQKGAADLVHRPSMFWNLPRSLPSGWQRQA